MKKFTVKDFITYNNPCFSCDNKINFYIGIQTVPPIDPDPKYPLGSIHPSFIRPIVSMEYSELDLNISYNNSLSLKIYHKTNKIDSNNMTELFRYLKSHRIILQSRCDKCFSCIESNDLSFNYDKKFIYPATIKSERLLVSDDENLYHMYSWFATGKTDLNVDKINRAFPMSPLHLKLPLLPLYKFKNRQHFIEKIKTYLVFS